MSQRINPFKRFNGLFIPELIYQCRDLTATAKLVYGRLLRYAGERGVAYPKQQTIADELGVSERSVRNALKALIDIKLIERDRGDRLNHEADRYYFLDPDSLDSQLPIEPAKSAATEPAKSAAPLKESHNTEESHKEKAKKKPVNAKYHKEAVESAAIPEFLNHPSFYGQWQEFCDSRLQSKKYLTELAISALLKKFEGFTVDEVCNALADSVIAGWAGVFPKKDKNAPYQPTQEEDYSWER